MHLESFLENKPLYYTEIDTTRMPRIYKKVKHLFQETKMIHLVGTNGKGTTGRFLASALHSMGYTVGHYTSPHILEFNERVWMDGENVSYQRLQKIHENLQEILIKEDADALSYFEYTTLLARLAFNECEYIVCEAGLGGRDDATAVFDKTLTLVTPIDFDHESFLGSTIEAISTAKLGAVQKHAILATQQHSAVYKVAQDLEEEKNLHIQNLENYLSSEDVRNAKLVAQELALAPYLEQNLQLSISALHFLGLSYKREHFKNAKLFGRLTQYKKNILLDVGHNPLAASSIVKVLEGKEYTLVYNTYKDKDYIRILEILKPIVKNVEILEIQEQRIETLQRLQKTLTNLAIEYKSFSAIDKHKNYLVFGSFVVVEAFLQRTRKVFE